MLEVKLRTETIIDIINNVPLDKIDSALAGLGECVKQFAVVKIACDVAGADFSEACPDTVTWIDDEKDNSTCNIRTVSETGEILDVQTLNSDDLKGGDPILTPEQ